MQWNLVDLIDASPQIDLLYLSYLALGDTEKNPILLFLIPFDMCKFGICTLLCDTPVKFLC